MSPSAALYLASPGDAGPALAVLAGRPLAFRAVLAAIRAGCPRVYVPGLFRHGPFERAVATSPAARAAVVWLEVGVAPPPGPLLLLPAAALIPHDSVRALLVAPPTAVLAASRDGGVPAVVVGAALGRALWPHIVAVRPLGDTLIRAVKDEPSPTVVDGGWCERVTSSRGRAEAEARLDAALGSPTDTGLDLLLHRRLSRPLSRLAVRLDIAPNQITLLSLVVGLAAAWCVWQAGPAWALAGLGLYALAVILDHVDGEVARLALTESSFGAKLDVAVDTLIHALLVIAMGVAAQRVAGGGAAFSGLVAALGMVVSALMTRTSLPATGGFGRILNALSSRDGFYALLALFLVGLAALPPALPVLMLVAATGGHAYWLGRLLYRRRPNTERKPK